MMLYSSSCFSLLCLLSGGGEGEYSEARSNSCPHRAASLTRGPCPSPGSPIVLMLLDRWREGVGVDSEGGVRGSGALLLLFFVY